MKREPKQSFHPVAPAHCIKVALLYKGNRVTSTVGTPEAIDRFSLDLARHANVEIRHNGENTMMSDANIQARIQAVVLRSTRGNNHTRDIVVLSEFWVMTITPYNYEVSR